MQVDSTSIPPTAALFLDDTLEVDASINEEKGTIFGILGIDRTLPQLHDQILVVGQTVVARVT